jgi:hypothetical protein
VAIGSNRALASAPAAVIHHRSPGEEHMSMLSSDYGRVVDNMEKAEWRLIDVFPEGVGLDFGKPFMPAAMCVGYEKLGFLNDGERLKLNQIFGNAYAFLFYFVEAYIIDMAMRHAEAELYGDDDNLRAMLRFADEEVKHQKMFQRFGKLFAAGFGTKTEHVENPQAVAQFILSKSPLAVTLVTLHLEIITQAHYVDCMRDRSDVDRLFQSLFKFHWMEEAQHAKIDALEIVKLRKDAAPEAVQQTIDDYFGIAGAFAELLAGQAKLDIVSLERAIGRELGETERSAVEEAQRRSYHKAFLGSGVTNAVFLEFLAEHFPNALPGAAKAAEAFA